MSTNRPERPSRAIGKHRTKMTHGEWQLQAYVAEQVRIRARMKRMSQKSLAEALGTHEVTVSHKLHQKSRFHLYEVYQLAEALGCQPFELMPIGALMPEPDDRR